MLISQNIRNIWDKIRQKHFRIRDIVTLEDYIVLSIISWMQGLPYIVECVKCNEFVFQKYRFDAFRVKWVLLSNQAEIIYLQSLGTEQQVMIKVRSFYREASFT